MNTLYNIKCFNLNYIIDIIVNFVLKFVAKQVPHRIFSHSFSSYHINDKIVKIDKTSTTYNLNFYTTACVTLKYFFGYGR